MVQELAKLWALQLASESVKRADSKLFAFDSEVEVDHNDEPVNRSQSNSKQDTSTGSTMKQKSSIDPNQKPTDVDPDFDYHRFSIALNLFHFAKTSRNL